MIKLPTNSTRTFHNSVDPLLVPSKPEAIQNPNQFYFPEDAEDVCLFVCLCVVLFFIYNGKWTSFEDFIIRSKV